MRILAKDLKRLRREMEKKSFGVSLEVGLLNLSWSRDAKLVELVKMVDR
jgi:hypothetical protein